MKKRWVFIVCLLIAFSILASITFIKSNAAVRTCKKVIEQLGTDDIIGKKANELLNYIDKNESKEDKEETKLCKEDIKEENSSELDVDSINIETSIDVNQVSDNGETDSEGATDTEDVYISENTECANDSSDTDNMADNSSNITNSSNEMAENSTAKKNNNSSDNVSSSNNTSNKNDSSSNTNSNYNNNQSNQTTQSNVQSSDDIVPGNGCTRVEYEVFELINQYRASVGLGTVTWSTNLYEGAKVRSREIATSFSHTRPNGENYRQLLGNNTAENIAGGSSTAVEVFNRWMNSEGHRKNILRPDAVSCTVALYKTNSGYGYYWVNVMELNF